MRFEHVISVTHTVATSCTNTTAMQQQVQTDQSVKPIYRNDFIQRFLAHHGQEQDALANVLWDRIFCISPRQNTLLESSLPYRGLSEAACNQIIKRFKEFGSGLDYRNLPQYFVPVFTKTEAQEPTTLIHYVESAHTNQDRDKWVVRCPDVDTQSSQPINPVRYLHTEHEKYANDLWQVANGSCTQDNLVRVTRIFCIELQKKLERIVDKEPISRYLDKLTEDFVEQQRQSGNCPYNPIVWLSRVANILLTPHLASANFLDQIEEICHMDLANPLRINKTLNALHFKNVEPAFVTRHYEHCTWGIEHFFTYPERTTSGSNTPQPLAFTDFTLRYPDQQDQPKDSLVCHMILKDAPEKLEIRLPSNHKEWEIWLLNYLSLQARAPTRAEFSAIMKIIRNQYDDKLASHQHRSRENFVDTLLEAHGLDSNKDQFCYHAQFLFHLYQTITSCCCGLNYEPEQATHYADSVKTLLETYGENILLFDRLLVPDNGNGNLRTPLPIALPEAVTLLKWYSVYRLNSFLTSVSACFNNVGLGVKTKTEYKLWLSSSKYLRLFGPELTRHMRQIQKDEEEKDLDRKNAKLQKLISNFNDLGILCDHFGLKVQMLDTHFFTNGIDNPTLPDDSMIPTPHSGDNNINEIAKITYTMTAKTDIPLFSKDDGITRDALFTAALHWVHEWNQHNEKKYAIGNRQNPNIYVLSDFLEDMQKQGLKPRTPPVLTENMVVTRKLFNDLANFKFLLGVFRFFPRGNNKCVEDETDPNWQPITLQNPRYELEHSEDNDITPINSKPVYFIGLDGKSTDDIFGIDGKKIMAPFVDPERIQNMHILPVLSKKLDRLKPVRRFIAIHLAHMTQISTLQELLTFLDELISAHLSVNTREVRTQILERMQDNFSSLFPGDYFERSLADESRSTPTTLQQQKLKIQIREEKEYKIIYTILSHIHGHEEKRGNLERLQDDFYETLVTELETISTYSSSALRSMAEAIQYFSCDRDTAIQLCKQVRHQNNAEKAEQICTIAKEHLKIMPSTKPAQLILDHYTLVTDKLKDTIASFHSPFIAEEYVARLLLRGAGVEKTTRILQDIAVIRAQFSSAGDHLLSLAEAAYQKQVDTSLTVLHDIAKQLDVFTANATTAQEESKCQEDEEAVHPDPHATKRMFSILCYSQKEPTLLPLFKAVLDKADTDPILKKHIVGYIDYLLRSNLEPHNALNQLKDTIERTKADQKKNALYICIQAPPYPTIERINAILDSPEATKQAENFKIKPYERVTNFQFKQVECNERKPDFVGVPDDLFKGKTWNQFIQAVINNRSKTQQELEKERGSGDESRILAYIIEKLARTASQYSNTDQIVSQELNTTQVMTLYALMHQKDKKHLMAEIATGEGKSRITIAYLAWEVLAKQRTVDLLTSNTMLSERDFLAYSDFLTGLNIPSALINMASAPTEYITQHGINFSDNHSLFLQRLKGAKQQYFTSPNTLLFCDEADTLFIDGHIHPYQIGEADDKSLILPKLYQIIFDYYRTEGTTHTVEKLHDYLYAQMDDLTIVEKKYIRPIGKPKLESLLDACRKAHQMSLGERYNISQEKHIVQTSAGQKRQRTIQALQDGRIQPGVIYENGLHAFLALKENHHNPDNNIYVQPENTTTSHAFLVNLLQHYGRTVGITGTTDQERFNGLKQHNVHYLKVPQLRRNKRVINRPIWTANADEQFQQIQALIGQHTNSPILIFTKNDQTLTSLQAYLSSQGREVTAIGADATLAEEKAAIERAGINQTITISTAGRLGRGTDISNPDSNLLVIPTYLENKRTMIQNAARTGRYGKYGIVKPVYNLVDYPQLTYSNKNLQKLTALQEHEAQTTTLTTQSCMILGLIKANIEQHIPEAKRSDYWKYINQEANRYYDLISQLVDQKALEAFTHCLIREIEVMIYVEPYSIPQIKNDSKISEAFERMVEFRNHPVVTNTHQEKTTYRYQRGDDGQLVTNVSGFIWWEKVKATFRGERRLFADFHAWRKGTGYAYPYGIPSWLIALWVIMPVVATVATIYVWKPVWTIAIALQTLAWIKGAALPATCHFFSTPLGLGIIGAITCLTFGLVIAYQYQKSARISNTAKPLLSSEGIRQEMQRFVPTSSNGAAQPKPRGDEKDHASFH